MKTRYPFKIDTMALLPEDLHGLWSLPISDGQKSVAHPTRLDLRKIGTTQGCPACSSLQLSNNLTIAKHQNNSKQLSCGDHIYIHNEGIHTLTDSGNQASFPSGYDLDHWFDHYVGTIPCNYSSGNRYRMCVKLFN